ncbi:MAG: hypothetical protein WBE53_08875, partial [Pseudolabrys sp.]
ALKSSWTEVQFLTRVNDKSGMLPHMSAFGQKRTCALQLDMSAKCQKRTSASFRLVAFGYAVNP